MFLFCLYFCSIKLFFYPKSYQSFLKRRTPYLNVIFADNLFVLRLRFIVTAFQVIALHMCGTCYDRKEILDILFLFLFNYNFVSLGFCSQTLRFQTSFDFKETFFETILSSKSFTSISSLSLHLLVLFLMLIMSDILMSDILMF